MRPLVVVIRSLTFVLLSALLVIVEGNSPEPLNTPADWAVSVDSTAADESEYPETTTGLLRVRVVGKSAPEPKLRPASLRTVGRFHPRSQSHRSSRHNLFLREAVMQI
jgi:hypothetical protein